MSRDLGHLHPDVQTMVEKFHRECLRQGIDLLVTCTWRSHAEQAALYAQGRTAPGRIVTRAKPGQSMHNFTLNGQPASLAVDVVPLENSKPVWAATAPVWQTVGAIGQKAGLEWAGTWRTFREFPHFQHPRARDLMKGAEA